MLRFVLAGLLALAIPVSFIDANDNKVAGPAKGDAPSLKFVPPDGQIKTSTLAVFKIQTNGKKVIIKVNSPDVEFKMDSGGTEVVFLFRSAGDFKIWGVTSLNDDLVESEVTVTVTQRDSPTPVPPPTPPTPSDPLIKEIQDAYNADNAVDKRERMAGLTRSMRYGSDQATVKASNGDIIAAVTSKTKDEIGDNLMGVRKVIGKYLNSVLPLENQQMNSDLRKKYSDAYNKVADALDKVSK